MLLQSKKPQPMPNTTSIATATESVPGLPSPNKAGRNRSMPRALV